MLRRLSARSLITLTTIAILTAFVVLLVEELLDAVIHAADEVDAVEVLRARLGRSRVGRQERQDFVDSPPERAQDEVTHAVDRVDVMPAREQHGAIRREVPDGIRVVLEGLPEAHRLFLQDLQIVTVEDLRLIDTAQLQVRVEGHVEVNDLIDEPLDTEIVDQELDLDDVLLDAF